MHDFHAAIIYSHYGFDPRCNLCFEVSAMPIDQKFIDARRATLEREKRTFLANANACDGALMILREIESAMTNAKSGSVSNQPDQPGAEPPADAKAPVPPEPKK